jgi:hypothetical protein
MRRPGFLAPQIVHLCFNQLREAETFFRSLQFQTATCPYSDPYESNLRLPTLEHPLNFGDE